MSFLFRCTPLPLGHPCLSLPERGSNFTLPQIVQFDRAINVSKAFHIYSTSLRGSYPDVCLDIAERILCFLVAPPCDPTSNGLPMRLCEQDCVEFTMLLEERTCDGLIELIRDYAETVGSRNTSHIITNFNCKIYHAFELNNYAKTCSGLLSKQYKGNVVGIEAKCVYLESHLCTYVCHTLCAHYVTCFVCRWHI